MMRTPYRYREIVNSVRQESKNNRLTAPDEIFVNSSTRPRVEIPDSPVLCRVNQRREWNSADKIPRSLKFYFRPLFVSPKLAFSSRVRDAFELFALKINRIWKKIVNLNVNWSVKIILLGSRPELSIFENKIYDVTGVTNYYIIFAYFITK